MAITSDMLSGIGLNANPDQINQLQSLIAAQSGGSGAAPGAGLSGAQIGGSPAGAPAGGLGNQSGFNTGFGMNVGTGQLALGGLQTLGNLWSAWSAQQLAEKSFDFNKQLSSDNYTNQAQAYNTNLSNIGRSRAAMEGQTAQQASDYISQNKVKTTV